MSDKVITKLGAIFLIATVSVILFFVLWILRFAFPSTKYLSKKYLSYIVNKNANNALQLARGDEGCKIFLREDIEKHIVLYGGKQVKNLNIKVKNGTGSDDEIQISTLTFQYASEDNSDWQNGKITLLTDHEFFVRYLCESLDFHGA